MLVRPGRWPERWLRSRGVTRCLLAALGSLLPLFVLERAARPFVERLTTIFEPDPELGWRHRPLAEDTYWGAWVRINAHGMRGPERMPEKPAGVRRLLMLGDSVVFGLSLEDDAETLPVRLERELQARAGGPFECLNAAVTGWSPLQHERYLAREGEGWRPDLVVLGFVLNDVPEGLVLASPGGGVLGVQRAYTRPASLPGWLAESGLYLALRELRLRRTLAGNSPAVVANRDQVSAHQVIFESDSDPVQTAWKQVLPRLGAILAWCRARAIPLVLVVFPYAIQLREPWARAPQLILASYASRRQLPCLDLLPPFLAARERGLGESDLFLDGLHPTATGNAIAAEELARFLVEHELFAPR